MKKDVCVERPLVSTGGAYREREICFPLYTDVWSRRLPCLSALLLQRYTVGFYIRSTPQLRDCSFFVQCTFHHISSLPAAAYLALSLPQSFLVPLLPSCISTYHMKKNVETFEPAKEPATVFLPLFNDVKTRCLCCPRVSLHRIYEEHAYIHLRLRKKVCCCCSLTI